MRDKINVLEALLNEKWAKSRSCCRVHQNMFIVHKVKLRIVNEPIVLGNPEVHMILFLLVLIGDGKLCSIRHELKE